MANIKQAYGSESTITISLNSLANGSDIDATAVNNSTDLFVDLLIQLILTGSAAGNTAYVEVYIKPSPDNSDFDEGAAGAENATLLGVIKMNGTGIVKKSFTLSQCGMLHVPKYWKLHVLNNSGAALASSGNSASVMGMYYTSS